MKPSKKKHLYPAEELKPTKKDWREEFDEQFPCVQVRAEDTDNDKLVKDFIAIQRKQACQEMIVKMMDKKGYKEKIEEGKTYIDGYWDAINAAKEYLNEL